MTTRGLIIYSVCGFVYFLILYFIAFFGHRHYREEDDFLFISPSQWEAVIILWLPVLVALVKK